MSTKRETVIAYFVSPISNPSNRCLRLGNNNLLETDEIRETLQVELPEGFSVGMSTYGESAVFDGYDYMWQLRFYEKPDRDSVKCVFLTLADQSSDVRVFCKILQQQQD